MKSPIYTRTKPGGFNRASQHFEPLIIGVECGPVIALISHALKQSTLGKKPSGRTIDFGSAAERLSKALRIRIYEHEATRRAAWVRPAKIWISGTGIVTLAFGQVAPQRFASCETACVQHGDWCDDKSIAAHGGWRHAWLLVRHQLAFQHGIDFVVAGTDDGSMDASAQRRQGKMRLLPLGNMAPIARSVTQRTTGKRWKLTSSFKPDDARPQHRKSRVWALVFGAFQVLGNSEE